MEGKQIIKPFLFDTCAWIWAALADKRLTSAVQKKLLQAPWFLSPISIWELGMLVKKKRIELSNNVEQWVHDSLARAPQLTLAPMEPSIAILSNNLKNCKLSDPADRIIIATAIHYNAVLVTGDKKIIEYGKSGHCHVMKV